MAGDKCSVESGDRFGKVRVIVGGKEMFVDRTTAASYGFRPVEDMVKKPAVLQKGGVWSKK